jgi:hypothetical protein
MDNETPDVQIEFTEEELSPDYDPTKNAGGDNVEEKETTTNETDTGSESNADAGTTEEAVHDEGGQDSATENKEASHFQTDAELAAIYGVSEEDIKYAKNMGWSTKDRFKGPESDWKDPKTFIDIAEQSGPILRDRMREMSKKITAMQEAFPTILDMQKRELQNRVDSLKATNESLQKELEEAHMYADSKKAQEITEKLMENRIKIALTEEEGKHIGEKSGLADTKEQTIVPDYIDLEKERAWRDTVYPKLTLEQREIYNEAVKFVMSPANADQTTDQRIAYIESKVFGRRSVPAASPVARPSSVDVTATATTNKNSEYEGWDSLSKEDKDIAISIIRETDWYKNRDTDPKSKAMWNDFKKQFKK